VAFGERKLDKGVDFLKAFDRTVMKDVFRRKRNQENEPALNEKERRAGNAGGGGKRAL